jgi:hypothetical protein
LLAQDRAILDCSCWLISRHIVVLRLGAGLAAFHTPTKKEAGVATATAFIGFY